MVPRIKYGGYVRTAMSARAQVDGILYEVDIKAYLDLANDKNLLQEIIGPLGLPRLMPELEDYFHYRNLDVSSIKELAKRWAPEVTKGVVKNGNHLALDDTRDSINELRHYREHLFKSFSNS